MSVSTQRLRALMIAALLGGAAFNATPAQAWWRGGFFIGVPPVVVAPAPYPYYYPPPAYYPPPYAYPPYYAPAAQSQPQAAPQAQTQKQGQVAYGAMCTAGVYRCAAPAYTPVGQTCSCPGLGAPSFGTAQ